METAVAVAPEALVTPIFPSLLAASLLAASLAAGAGDEPLNLANDCLSCHRPDADGVPVITGQHRDYLEAQLLRFRDRHRDTFPMSALAAGIEDAGAARIADALAAVPWHPARARVVEARAARGSERVEALECTACHGNDFAGTGAIPRLAGQHPHYLQRQLQSFGEFDRYHPPTGIGTRMYALEAEDAAAIAAHLYALGAPAPVIGAGAQADEADQR